MFRNQYDSDVSVWSPQGRIHQIEYAMEAVKQGSAAIGLKSNDYACMVVLKRAPSELSSYQEKILTIDDHVGVAMAGLTADGRLLAKAMRRECYNNKWAYEEPLPVNRLLNILVNKMQLPTQRYGRRPFGVGMLVAGFDHLGPRIYYLCPSANEYDFKCTAIGARSQSARTYLERHVNEFAESSLDELVVHGLLALQSTLSNEVEISNKNCSVAIVGKDKKFTIFENENLDRFIELFTARREELAPAPDPEEGEPPADEPMQEDAPAP
ncbi:Proteasome subunit alpha 1 [Cichlidogyrus casuarinus]|uniref:Proteasome subunit alpha type n=1 Tax=Cichlidogyrus casuarinus TaxID=1844966 RepID=A0ABD2QD84_9PLAT